MVDIRHLRENLSRLTETSEVTADGARRLPISTPGDAFTAIIDEVDVTILPRCLIFQNAQMQHFALNVVSRRVMSFSDSNPLPPAEKFDAVSDRKLSVLRERLSIFAGGSAEITVSARIFDAPKDFTNIGVRGLALCAKDDGPSEQDASAAIGDGPRDLSNFIEQSSELVVALVGTEGTSVTITQGDATLLSTLQDLALTELSGISDPSDIIAQDQCIVMLGPKDTRRGVLCGVSGTQMVFAAFDNEKLDDILALWSAA